MLNDLGLKTDEYLAYRFVGRKITDTDTLDGLIREGKTIKDIASLLGVAHYSIRNYMNRTKSYDVWKAKRDEEKIRKRNLLPSKKDFVNFLKVLEISKAKRISLACEKAVEYSHLRANIKSTDIPFDAILNLFEVYYSAIKSNKKLSLSELQEECGIHFVTINRILNKVGLNAMHGSKNRLLYTSLSNEVINLNSLGLNPADVAYFLGVSKTYVQGVLRGNMNRNRGFIEHIGPHGTLTIRTASKVYEAVDAGFSSEDTLELLTIKSRLYNLAVERRETLEPIIINALDIIHPEVKHLRPYL